MKKAKKLLALLLAGVLALGVLTGCSGGSAGPLTKENVTDYIIDYYKAGTGIQFTESARLKSVADNVLAYVNKEIGNEKYKGVPTQRAFQNIVNGADNKTKAQWLGDLPQEEGYMYSVGYASTEETYKTELFNQGKTAVAAMALLTYRGEIVTNEWTKEPAQFPTTGELYVMECTVNGQKGMIAVFREPITEWHGGGSIPDPDEDDASSSAASDPTGF